MLKHKYLYLTILAIIAKYQSFLPGGYLSAVLPSPTTLKSRGLVVTYYDLQMTKAAF